MNIEETHYSNENKAPVFKLSNLAQLHVSASCVTLGVKLDTRVHTMQCLLARCTDMQAQARCSDSFVCESKTLRWIPSRMSKGICAIPIYMILEGPWVQNMKSG